MLLLSRALLPELPYDLFSEARRLREDIVQPIEHLSEVFRADGSPVVRHSLRKDYGLRG